MFGPSFFHFSSRFEEEYKKLPRIIKLAAEEKEKMFRGNPRDSRLKTHKLHGRLSGFWSFSIDREYRALSF